MPSALSSATPSHASQRYSPVAAISSRTAISCASATRASAAVRSTRCWREWHGRGSPRACRRSAQVQASLGACCTSAQSRSMRRPPSLGAPPPGRRHGNPRALRGRCEDWNVLLQSRLRSTALRASCWALRAIGPRLWSGPRCRACSACAHGSTGDAPPPVDLLGLGPGLTPSGDDVLCGMLVALRAVGQAGMAPELYAALAAAAPTATSPISAAFLRAAAEGLGCEALHAAIAAVLEGQADAVSGPRRGFGPHRPHLRLGHAGRSHARLAGIRLNAKAACRSRMGADLRVSSTRRSVARDRVAPAQRIWGLG